MICLCIWRMPIMIGNASFIKINWNLSFNRKNKHSDHFFFLVHRLISASVEMCAIASTNCVNCTYKVINFDVTRYPDDLTGEVLTLSVRVLQLYIHFECETIQSSRIRRCERSSRVGGPFECIVTSHRMHEQINYDTNYLFIH